MGLKFGIETAGWVWQVYWLLLAISQDRPKNTYVAELRDQCERAALEGYWVSLDPWLRGLVSSTQTCTGMPWSCAA